MGDGTAKQAVPHRDAVLGRGREAFSHGRTGASRRVQACLAVPPAISPAGLNSAPSRRGPFDGPATESPRLCRGIVTQVGNLWDDRGPRIWRTFHAPAG
jgi:hypothetical protein